MINNFIYFLKIKYKILLRLKLSRRFRYKFHDKSLYIFSLIFRLGESLEESKLRRCILRRRDDSRLEAETRMLLTVIRPFLSPRWLYVVRNTISQKLGIILEILVHVVYLFFFLFLSLFVSSSSSSSSFSLCFFFLTIISVLSVPSSFVELRPVACNKELLEGKNFPVKKTP